MSYDLYLKPDNDVFSKEKFRQYFSGRDKYNLEGSQAWYENEDTGVYFLFELQNENDFEEGETFYPVLFNMNYFRPFYFANEAEPELNAFVSFFSMVVDDSQTEGMGRGSYNSGKFYSGWKHGNEFGYQSILKDNPDVYSFPTETLNYIWEWNFHKNTVQESVTDDVFVPSIMLLTYRGDLVSAVVWPDAIPSLIPHVDILIIDRKELAPRRLLKKSEDMAIGLLSDFLPLIDQYKEKKMNGGYYLYYESVPKSIRQKVKSLPSSEGELEKVPFDQVLDADVVNKYMA